MRREPSRGLVVYALVLFALTLAVAMFGPYPISVIGWLVAAVAALFLAIGVILPAMRR